MKLHPQVSAAIANQTTKTPPAQAARAALADDVGLGNQPFGKLVSAFARGVQLPPSSSSAPETVADPVVPQDGISQA
jgi:hypothetical protein